jgi:hypothetical protein
MPASPSSDQRDHVVVATFIAANRARVWRALTVPTEVAQWDGVERAAVPEGYPAPGQHARWRLPVGPLTLTLHDRVRIVDRDSRFSSSIDVGFVHLEEQYTLASVGSGTIVVSENEVVARRRVLRRVARRLTRRNVRTSMQRLKRFCESTA